MSDDFQQVIDCLARCKRVLVTTHVRPDGDALGTCCALVLAMRTKGIESEVLLLSHLPRKYAFVFDENGIVHHDAEKQFPVSLDLHSYHAIVVADTGTWSQLPGLKERIESWKKPRIVIDHHLTQEDWADVKLVRNEAAAAGEIVAQLLERWAIPFDTAIASALFLAIASDTGWFQFPNTRPFTMRLAAQLMELGVNTDRMYQLVYQNERKERVAIQTRAMQSLELLCDDRVAVMTLHKQDFEDTNAQVLDTENLVNVPLQIRTVEVALLITEPRDFGPVRVSLRSKGRLDVAKFAEQFGGGGHARAAGLKFETSLENARKKVTDAVQREFSRLPALAQ